MRGQPASLEEALVLIEDLKHRLKHAQDEFLPLGRVAHLLDVAPLRLRQLVEAGKIDAIRDRTRGGHMGYKVQLSAARRAIEAE